MTTYVAKKVQAMFDAETNPVAKEAYQKVLEMVLDYMDQEGAAMEAEQNYQENTVVEPVRA